MDISLFVNVISLTRSPIDDTEEIILVKMEKLYNHLI